MPNKTQHLVAAAISAALALAGCTPHDSSRSAATATPSGAAYVGPHPAGVAGSSDQDKERTSNGGQGEGEDSAGRGNFGSAGAEGEGG